MGEKRKLQTSAFVSEDDISTLLQRYTAMTVLTVLQEVAQVQDVHINWNELVKTTITGITNAREYQMLWRHLAYRHGLLDKFDDAAQPLDDDSDLECELEAFPSISSEASAEAAACVKVLIASGVACDLKMSDGNTIEAPLTISIPNGQTSRTALENSVHGTKITVPVTVEKQPHPFVTGVEGLENTNGLATANYPPRRKRKPWSEAEDMELIAAVQKYGEGNWANILKGDFTGERTASQLSQRWATIRRRHGGVVVNNSQLSEAQLAARHAMSVALGDNRRAPCPISTSGVPNSGNAPSNSPHFAAANKASGGAQSDLVLSLPRVIAKNPLPKPAIGPDSMVKASTMTAAGARVATVPSGVALLQKTAAESKKVIHVPPGGIQAIKSSVPASSNGLPSNVHFIRTGLISRPAGPSKTLQPGLSRATHPGPSKASQPGPSNASLRPASPAIRPNPAAVPSRTNASVGVLGAPASSPMTVLEIKTKAAATIQKNQVAVPFGAHSNKFEVNRAASLGNNTPQQQVRKAQTLGSGNLPIEKVEGRTSILSNAVMKEPGDERKASKIPSLQTVSNNSIGNQGENSNKEGNKKIDSTVERESITK